MKLIALFVAVALLPVAAAAGFVAKPDPPQPPKQSLRQHMASKLKLDEESGDVYQFAITAGPLMGTSYPAADVLPYTDEMLRQQLGKGAKWKWLLANCWNYSSSGDPQSVDDKVSGNICRRKEISRAQARKGVEEQVARAVAQGTPASPTS